MSTAWLGRKGSSLAGRMLLPWGAMLILCGTANAQVTPDGTLNTSVSHTGNNFTITNGRATGTNLFHSFGQFSVPTGGSASFDLVNTSNISTIFSRVTGGSISNIDGVIRTLNSTNPVTLFLLNPSGIVFGPNARLQLGGSFIGTTANSIIFGDGFRFNADATSEPLLTMSAPIGLQLGSNAGAIQVGLGATNYQAGLQVSPGMTLALVGGEIEMNGGNLTAPDGRVDLLAVRNSQVALDNAPGWQIGSITSTAPDWGTISLRQFSLVNATGINGGTIHVRSRGLTLQDGSQIIADTFSGQGQGITVQTTEFVDLLGTSGPGQSYLSGISASALGLGATSGNVTVETGRLLMANGALLGSVSLGPNSRSGNVIVQATDVELSGFNRFFPEHYPSGITNIIYGNNSESGQITIDAQRIRLLDGSEINAQVLVGSGKAGNISIQASDSFEIQVNNSLAYNSSGVFSTVGLGTTGQGGNIAINAGSLQVLKGGTISSGISGTGQAGNIDIRASSVTVSSPIIDGFTHNISGINVGVSNTGVGRGGNITLKADSLRVFNGGQITSSSEGNGSAGKVNLQVNNIEVQGISQPLPDGRQLPSAITASSTTAFAAGDLNITARTLNVRDGGTVAVSNSATGDAGNLKVAADNILLDNRASLRAEVNGGAQGNIGIQLGDVILLRHGSNITTNATGASTGGNINSNGGLLVAVPQENSSIVANAVRGRGGNIAINTQGIFGLKYGSQITSSSYISASSQFGVSGTVQINNITVNPNSGLVELPSMVADAAQKIISGCNQSQGSRLVATGRGGIPENPTLQVMDSSAWSDVRELSAYRKPGNLTANVLPSTDVLVQATGWHRNADGKIELIADRSSTHVQPPLTCAAVPKS